MGEDYWDYLNMNDNDITDLLTLFGGGNNFTNENVALNPDNDYPPSTLTTDPINQNGIGDEEVSTHAPNHTKIGIQLFVCIIGVALNFAFIFLILIKKKYRRLISNM